MDPKSFNNGYTLDKKSDVYSVGVLLWEISSGHPPFYTEGIPYDVYLVLKILEGQRETTIPDTPDDYAKLYIGKYTNILYHKYCFLLNLKIYFFIECWDGEPENRPPMCEVVERLKMIIKQSNIPINYYQDKSPDGIKDQVSNECIAWSSKSSSLGELSRIICNFDRMNAEEIFESFLIKIVDEVVTFIFRGLNEGKFLILDESPVLDFLNNQDINSNEIYNWLSNNQSHSNSIFLFGYFNFFGIETIKNYEKAFNLFNDASRISEQRHVLAQCYVGICYENGYGVIKDKKLAFKYIEQIIANEDFAIVQATIGYYYENGIGIEINVKMAIYWYEKSAEQGHQYAQYNLAHIYQNGDGIDKDIDKAIYWYEKSAKQGHMMAQYNLAYMYKNGMGVDKDINKATFWYEKSAKQGCLNAQFNLALIYDIGNGIDKDTNKAIHWYKESAEQGHQYAQYNLAYIYKNGDGIDKDIDKAIYWYEKSAEQGHQYAQYNLAYIYKNGDGIDKDIDKAIYWYEKSAEQGDSIAQYNLAYIYQNEDGIDKDMDKAIYWYEKSAKQGNKYAQKKLKRLLKIQSKKGNNLCKIN